jgi:uncharacterized protein (DUF433 family)/DNA-binding transcriptional MerR regulator
MLNSHKMQRVSAIGRGVYDASETLRLVNFQRDETTRRKVDVQTIRRWIEGYTNNTQFIPPLWKPDYINEGSELEVSFRDLIELRFIKAFRNAGVTLQTIRVCVQEAVSAVGNDRPFSTHKFRTDGKTIFEHITVGVHEGEMTDLKTRQSVFRRMIEPSLKDLEFEGDQLVRWRPLGPKSVLVVDPAKAFGRPVILGFGVTAEALALAVEVEGSFEAVARLYEVPVSAVRDSIALHERLAA